MRRILTLILVLWGCQAETESIDSGAEIDRGRSNDIFLAQDVRPDRAVHPTDMTHPDAHLDGALPDLAILDLEILDTLIPDASIPDLAIPDAAIPDLELPDVFAGEIACFDGLDNDGDGRIDCGDPDCRRAVACFRVQEICDNGMDDTGDDHIDCDDVTCAGNSECPTPDVPAYTTAEVEALFRVECAPCHTREQPDARLALDQPLARVAIDVPSSQVDDLMRIKPGDRAQSYLFRKVAYTYGEVSGGGGEGMPPLTPLSRTQLERFGRWIDNLPR